MEVSVVSLEKHSNYFFLPWMLLQDLSENAQVYEKVGRPIDPVPSNEQINHYEDNWVAAGGIPRHDSDSETDDEELWDWAVKMFGVARKKTTQRKKRPKPKNETTSTDEFDWDAYGANLTDIHIPISEKVKLGRRRKTEKLGELQKVEERQRQQQPLDSPKKLEDKVKTKRHPKCLVDTSMDDPEMDVRRCSKMTECDDPAEMDVTVTKKEPARTLTAAEVHSILSQDNFCGDNDGMVASHWVRRSSRQPSRSALLSPLVMALLEKLRSNDTDMVVLKMKKYISDPDAPTIVLDAALDALEENTNCESLYIQVREIFVACVFFCCVDAANCAWLIYPFLPLNAKF